MCLDEILRDDPRTLPQQTIGYVVVHKSGKNYYPLYFYIFEGSEFKKKMRKSGKVVENGWHGFRTLYGAATCFHEIKYCKYEADTIVKCLFEEIETSGVVMVSGKKLNAFTAKYRTVLEEISIPREVFERKVIEWKI